VLETRIRVFLWKEGEQVTMTKEGGQFVSISFLLGALAGNCCLFRGERFAPRPWAGRTQK